MALFFREFKLPSAAEGGGEIVYLLLKSWESLVLRSEAFLLAKGRSCCIPLPHRCNDPTKC